MKTILALFITLFLWSSSLIGIHIGLESFDAGSLALLRYLTASVCMLLFFIKYGRHHKPSLMELGMTFLAGTIGFTFYNIFLNQGVSTVDPGTASFILSQIPVVIVLLAMVFLRERLNIFSWLGILICIAGISMVAFGKSTVEMGKIKINIGIIYILMATLCHASYAIINKSFLRKLNPIEFTSYAMWGGTLALLFYTPPLIRELAHASVTAILAGIYIGIFPAAIGYLTWSYALNHLPASKVGSILYMQPILTIMLSWVFLHEIPTTLSLIGGFIALVGAIIVSQGHRVKFRVRMPA